MPVLVLQLLTKRTAWSISQSQSAGDHVPTPLGPQK
jgi:hypothetical protein